MYITPTTPRSAEGSGEAAAIPEDSEVCASQEKPSCVTRKRSSRPVCSSEGSCGGLCFCSEVVVAGGAAVGRVFGAGLVVAGAAGLSSTKRLLAAVGLGMSGVMPGSMARSWGLSGLGSGTRPTPITRVHSRCTPCSQQVCKHEGRHVWGRRSGRLDFAMQL